MLLRGGSNTEDRAGHGPVQAKHSLNLAKLGRIEQVLFSGLIDKCGGSMAMLISHPTIVFCLPYCPTIDYALFHFKSLKLWAVYLGLG